VTEIAYATTIAALILGVILGYGLRLFLSKFLLAKPVAPQDLSAFMTRIVNVEGAQEYRTQMVKQLQVSGRRTMRTDGGPPARVHKMRKTKRQLRSQD
jgi:hypothetical protein